MLCSTLEIRGAEQWSYYPFFYKTDQCVPGADKTVKQMDIYKFVWQTGTEEQKWKVEYAAPFVCIWTKQIMPCVSIFYPMLIFPSNVPSLSLWSDRYLLPCPQKWTACIMTSQDTVLTEGLSIKKEKHNSTLYFSWCCIINILSQISSVFLFVGVLISV